MHFPQIFDPVTPPSDRPPIPSMQMLRKGRYLFTSPSKVFEHYRDAGTRPWDWLGPLLLYMALFAAAAIVVFNTEPLASNIQKMVQTSMEQKVEAGTATPNDARIFSENVVPVLRRIGPVLIPLGMAAFMLMVALLVWAAVKIFHRGPFRFSLLLSIFGAVWIVAIVEFIVTSVIVILTGKIGANFSPAVLSGLSVTSAGYKVLSQLNPFFLYSVFILGLGLHVAGKIPKGKAAAIAAGFFICWVGMQAL